MTGTNDKAEELARIAVELVTRVRDDEPEAVHRWLAGKVDPADWMGLAIVLACAVPDDQSWKELTAWTWVRHMRPSRTLQPCGTIAALRRHQVYGEAVCEDCKAADRERKRAERKAKAELSTAGDNNPQGYPQSPQGIAA